jgi:hypothetical protein
MRSWNAGLDGGIPAAVENLPEENMYPGEPALESSVGEALRTAASMWPSRVALIEGTIDGRSRRRWTFAELLEESEKVAPALLLRSAPGARGRLVRQCPGMASHRIRCGSRRADAGYLNPTYLAQECK